MIDIATPPRAFDAVRLRLRTPGPADAPRLVELANDFAVTRMTTSMPYPYTLADAEAWVAHAAAADPADEALFVIDLPGEGPIGTLGFDPDGALAEEVGYFLGQPYWGRGYATEALAAGLIWARDHWRRRCITARHFVDNPASATVLAKAGFLYTGRTEMRQCRSRGEAVLCRWMVWLA